MNHEQENSGRVTVDKTELVRGMVTKIEEEQRIRKIHEERDE